MSFGVGAVRVCMDLFILSVSCRSGAGSVLGSGSPVACELGRGCLLVVIRHLAVRSRVADRICRLIFQRGVERTRPSVRGAPRPDSRVSSSRSSGLQSAGGVSPVEMTALVC